MCVRVCGCAGVFLCVCVCVCVCFSLSLSNAVSLSLSFSLSLALMFFFLFLNPLSLVNSLSLPRLLACSYSRFPHSLSVSHSLDSLSPSLSRAPCTHFTLALRVSECVCVCVCVCDTVWVYISMCGICMRVYVCVYVQMSHHQCEWIRNASFAFFWLQFAFRIPSPLFGVRGSSYPFSNFGAVMSVFRKHLHFNFASSYRAATVREAYPAPQSGAWRSELVLVRLRPVYKDNIGEAGSCPWLPSSSQKASPPRSIKN